MPPTRAPAPFSPTHYTSYCIKLSWFHSLNSFQIFGQKLSLSNNSKLKMTVSLQIISISDYERTKIYQTETRESISCHCAAAEREASILDIQRPRCQSLMASVVNEESYNAAQLCARSHCPSSPGE